VQWWNLDLHRSDHPVAFIIDIGGRMRPVITPQDAAGVTAELVIHGSTWCPAYSRVCRASPDISYMRRISTATPIRSDAGASSTNSPSIRSSLVTR
jgi:hypothetical protein